jgi:hypothetical protein
MFANGAPLIAGSRLSWTGASRPIIRVHDHRSSGRHSSGQPIFQVSRAMLIINRGDIKPSCRPYVPACTGKVERHRGAKYPRWHPSAPASSCPTRSAFSPLSRPVPCRRSRPAYSLLDDAATHSLMPNRWCHRCSPARWQVPCAPAGCYQGQAA